jgi:hypothetical protein
MQKGTLHMRSISHPKRVALVLIAALVAALGLAACDPDDPVQRQAFYAMNPDVPAEELTLATMNEAQRAVVKALQDRQTAFYLGIIAAEQQRASLSTDCVAAMRAVWPPSMHGWAMGIMKRESGFSHTADNPSSTAAGCWQMLAMHNWRYAEVGCSSADIYNALCNNRAAYHLYRQAGTSPWHL